MFNFDFYLKELVELERKIEPHNFSEKVVFNYEVSNIDLKILDSGITPYVYNFFLKCKGVLEVLKNKEKYHELVKKYRVFKNKMKDLYLIGDFHSS